MELSWVSRIPFLNCAHRVFNIMLSVGRLNLWYYASRMSKRGVQGPKPMLECATVVNPFSGMSGNMQPIISKETS